MISGCSLHHEGGPKVQTADWEHGESWEGCRLWDRISLGSNLGSVPQKLCDVWPVI